MSNELLKERLELAMSNEWLEIAWINYAKAILHGQIVVDNKEIAIEQILTSEQKAELDELQFRHRIETFRLLRSFVND